MCIDYGLSNGKPPGLFWNWIAQYRENGASAFFRPSGNQSYTADFKRMVVQEYLNGNGSATELCARYRIPRDGTLLKWVSLYNANRELKDYCPNREVYMADERRKTTIEERKEIVKY